MCINAQVNNTENEHVEYIFFKMSQYLYLYITHIIYVYINININTFFI